MPQARLALLTLCLAWGWGAPQALPQPALPQSIPVPRPSAALPSAPVAPPVPANAAPQVPSQAPPQALPQVLPQAPPQAPAVTPAPAASSPSPWRTPAQSDSEALALPEADPPLGQWGDRADVEPLSLASLPWRGGTGLSNAGVTRSSGGHYTGGRYGVWVALPSDRHRQRLQQLLPHSSAISPLKPGLWQPAGDFAEPQEAEALARALQQYGFGVQVQRR